MQRGKLAFVIANIADTHDELDRLQDMSLAVGDVVVVFSWNGEPASRDPRTSFVDEGQ